MPGKFPGGHALLIGVGSYQYSAERNAPHTVIDAEQLEKVLTDPAFCGYDQKNIIPLHDPNRQDILSVLESHASTLKESDTLFMFYAGHGMYDQDGHYYLTAHDTVFEKIDKKTFVVPNTGVRDDELIALLRKISSRRLLTIFNACHSGSISPGTLGDEPVTEEFDSYGIPESAQHEILTTGEGRVVITACRSDQKACYITEPVQPTVFGQALIEGLSGKGDIPNKKGYISLFDLYEYLYDRVHQRVYNWWKRQQEPVLTVQDMVGSFPISLYQGSFPGLLGEFDALEPAPRGAVNQVPEIRLTVTLADLPKTITDLQDPLILQQLLLKSAGTPVVSSDDYELVSFYRICFTRPAFQSERTHKQNLLNLDDAVKDTITAINTGCLLDRISKKTLKSYEGKLFLTNDRWNQQMDLIGELLRKIRNTIRAYNDSEPDYEDKGNIIEIINKARVQVMKQFNQICQEAGMPPIPFG